MGYVDKQSSLQFDAVYTVGFIQLLRQGAIVSPSPLRAYLEVTLNIYVQNGGFWTFGKGFFNLPGSVFRGVGLSPVPPLHLLPLANNNYFF